MSRNPMSLRGRSSILILLVLWVPGCTPGFGGPAPAGSGAKSPNRVRVARPVPAASDDSYPSNLYVERDAILTARASGIIEKVLADRGSRVKAGDPLAILETDLASGELEKKEQALKLAQVDFEQIQSLHEQNIASSHDFLVASIARDQAATDVELARAALERCHVRAPFDGTVVERWAVMGQRVVEDDSTPLFRLAAADALRARVDVPERRLSGLKLGGKALVAPGDEAGPPQDARIVFLGPAVDAASGTAPVIVELGTRNNSSRLGASVRVRFERSNPGADPPLVRLPREAFPSQVVERNSEVTLLVIENGRAASRKVRVVESRGGDVLVSGPLAASDRIIVDAAEVREGEEVLAGEEIR